MVVGILTEKPSAAKKFATALGGTSGTYNGEAYVIVAARGHLYELAAPEKQIPGASAALQKALADWELKDLPWDESAFTWPLEAIPGTSAQSKEIKSKLAGVDEIVIATDMDPTGEGDAIAWNIINELRLKPRSFSRMEFTDEAPASLQKAFTARRKGITCATEGVFAKAQFRNRFDFLTIQFTRVASRASGQRVVIRQGRLKSAMVQLVGDGLAAYNAWKKVPFYENRFRDENGVMYTNPEEPRFPNKSQVAQTYSASDVVLDKRSNKRSAPPKLLDLASLAAMMSPQGYNAAGVLKTYQSMYEATIVSYPRTEDKVITPEQYKEMLPLVDKIAALVGVDSSLLTVRIPRSTHVRNGAAHGANRPGLTVPASLQAVESQFGKAGVVIYTLLAKSFLAMMAEDYVYERQEGHVRDYAAFVGSVNVPKSPGWKLVFNENSDVDEDESTSGLGTRAQPFIHEGIPPRPPHPSMTWLMKQLERRDVGTGATRTSTYADVTNAKAKFPLLVDSRGKITMAEVGDMSYRLLPGTRIGDLGLTEHVYAQMKQISEGTLNPDVALAQVAQWVRDDIKTMTANAVKMKKELNMTDTVAPKKEKYAGTWRGQEIEFTREWGGVRFTDAQCEDLLASKEITFPAVSKAGNNYDARGSLAQQEYNGNSFIGFQPDFGPRPGESAVPKSLCGHTFTDAERAKLDAGESITVEKLKSKAGNVFTAILTVGKKPGETRDSIIFSFPPR